MTLNMPLSLGSGVKMFSLPSLLYRYNMFVVQTAWSPLHRVRATPRRAQTLWR